VVGKIILTPFMKPRGFSPPPDDSAILLAAMRGAIPIDVPVRTLELDAWVEPPRVMAAIARQPSPAILDSGDAHVADPRYTVVACDPARVLEATHPHDADPFAALATDLRAVRVHTPADVPFVPGWIGYLGYEAGRYLEPAVCRHVTTRREIALPDVRMGLYDTIAVADLNARRWTIVAVDLPPALAGPRPPADGRAKQLADRIERAAELPEPDATETRHDTNVTTSINRDRFMRKVEQAQDYITAGDIFQANLCHHLTAVRRVDPFGLYRRLRSTNPAQYAAYLAFDDKAICSASPELFLSLRGRNVVTRPIKGTRPRTGIAERDARHRRELAASEKDHAELAMIIDLERNDLGRVSEFGSVRVRTPWQLEAHPTVYHLVATVTGTLRPGCDAVDLLAATFPGGSITGAPKVRAMQIIDALEETTRSVYCGAIGHVGLNGDLTLNIAIRTIIVDGATLHLPVGAGIVADSVPADEYDETLAKGAGMLAAVNAEPSGVRPNALPAPVRSVPETVT
jgi:para-aminobenzoate synthetase component 1